MSDDETAGPSFLLAQHDIAHREHTRTSTHNTHTHAQRKESQHQHHRLHRREPTVTTRIVEEVVTQVFTTISVVQQIDVDTNGNTITIQTRLADPASFTAPGVLTDPFSLSVTSADSQIPSTVTGSSSLSSGLGAAPVSTSTSLTQSSFSSFLASTNSTTLITSSSSLSHTSTFSNSSISSRTSRSSLRSSSLKFSSSTLSISSSITPTSIFPGTETSLGPFGGLSTGVGGSEPSSTPVSNGSGNSTDTTPTPVVIGGVVGSVAGVAVIIVALLFIFRWKRRGGQMLSSRAGESGGDGNEIHEGPSSPPPGDMTERRSLGFALPTAFASLTGNKRQSQKTEGTLSSTAGSERGFYRVSGRKLPSVLQTGGDGYGGGIPNEQTLSGSSFYRDSQGFYGGPGGPASPPVGVSMQGDGEIPIMRPSPARTPVTEHGPFADDLHTPPKPPPPPRPDGLGRSRSSQDGSHTSRFTEEV